MKNARSILALALCGLGSSVVFGYQQASNHKVITSRRNILTSAASAVAAATLVLSTPPRSARAAAEEDPLVPVYFGVGVSLGIFVSAVQSKQALCCI